MFRPAECFKAAIACPIVAYLVEAGVYHHHGRGLLLLVAFFGAVPAFFGLLGMLGG
jgi:hypothetical protein